MGNIFENKKELSHIEELVDNYKEEDFSFIDNIYAQKTPYFLKDAHVEYDDE